MSEKKIENIESILQKIRDERDYQDHLCTIKELPLDPTIEGELVMLKTYIDKTLTLWTKNPSNAQVLSEIRKISGIAIRCLENHGCPKRDMSDMLKVGNQI